jgi:hypothetical protein
VPRTNIVGDTDYCKYNEGHGARRRVYTATRVEQGEDDLGIVDALAQLSFLVQGTLAKHAAAKTCR